MSETRVGIVGLGTIGRQELNLLCGADLGVVGYDTNPRALELVAAQGEDGWGAQRPILTSEASALYACDVLVLCLPTVDINGQVSLAAFDQFLTAFGGRTPDEMLVVVASSVPVGYSRKLASELGTTLLATAPERFDPGGPLELARIPRVVAGLNPNAQDRVVAHYQHLGVATTLVTSPEVAEASKILENSFRLLNIAFANEFADICRRLNIAAAEVIEAAATKPFGFMAHLPGPGAGGVCIPVIPRYLVEAASKLGTSLPILETALAANDNEAQRIVDTLCEVVPVGRTSRVLVVGATYKANYPDPRGSSALRLIRALAEHYLTEVLDPFISEADLPSGVLLHRVPPQGQFAAVVVAVAHKTMPVDEIRTLAPVIFDLGRGELLVSAPPERQNERFGVAAT